MVVEEEVMREIVDLLQRSFGDRVLGWQIPVAGQLQITVDKDSLAAIALYLQDTLEAPLVSMVGSDERPIDGYYRLYYVFSLARERLFLILVSPLSAKKPAYPSVTPHIPAAHWYEREVKDMFGIVPVGHPDPRRLVRHKDWPQGIHPLRKDFDPMTQVPRVAGEFPFRPVEGEGVFQIPVGPIHAGIIEPGHFRFSAVGESVIHLEARLFYTYRGIEKLAEDQPYKQVAFMAERICGVCAFSHSLAYTQAIEKIAGVVVPERARYLRTLLGEMERLYNHVGDVGNICAGTGFAFGVSQGARLKEGLMGLNERITGHRYLRGVNALGGIGLDLTLEQQADILSTLGRVEGEFREVVDILLTDDSYLQRVETTGVLPEKTARDLGAVGMGAKASGIRRDFRKWHPYAAYGEMDFKIPVFTEGDVLARIKVRVEEVYQSLSIVRQILKKLPEGPMKVEIGNLPPYRSALGWAESARGDHIHWVMTGPDNTIYRYAVRSASYCNWPALATAVPGNIVPDFPLINKSFELCYSCTDR